MRARIIESKKVQTVFIARGMPVTHEWTEIPAGAEQQAREHPYLEIEPEETAPKRKGRKDTQHGNGT